MNRRAFLRRASGVLVPAALAGGVFVPKFERWFPPPNPTRLWAGDAFEVSWQVAWDVQAVTRLPPIIPWQLAGWDAGPLELAPRIPPPP